MLRTALTALATMMCTSSAIAQDVYYGHQGVSGGPITYTGGIYTGHGSIGSSEPMFAYDDLEPWKHGYLHIMPYYEGLHSFRPYNYKQIFAQSQTAAAWGMPNTMPYSQQFWHRYEQQTDLSAPRTPLLQFPASNGHAQQPAYPSAPSYPGAQQSFARPTSGAAWSSPSQSPLLRQQLYPGPQLP